MPQRPYWQRATDSQISTSNEMAEIRIEIWRNDVLTQVKMSSAYLGAKRTDAKDPESFERVSLVDANDEQLHRFWTESCETAL